MTFLVEKKYKKKLLKLYSKKKRLKGNLFIEKLILLCCRNHPDHYIKLGIRKIGKEILLENIAKEIKEKILVSQERYEMLKDLQRPDVYTTDPDQSRIEAMLIHMVFKNIEKYL